MSEITRVILPPGKAQDVFCLFVLFQNTLKFDVYVPNLVSEGEVSHGLRSLRSSLSLA